MILPKTTKLFILAFLLLISINTLFSQTDVKTNIENENNFASFEKIIWKMKFEEFNYVFTQKEGDYLCKKYTEAMKFVEQKTILLKNIQLFSIHELNGKFVIIYRNEKKSKHIKENSFEIFGHFFNPKTMELDASNISLVNFDFKKMKIHLNSFEVFCENDYLAISQPIFKNKSNHIYKGGFRHQKITLFSNKLNKLWVKEFGNTNETKFCITESIAIDKKGTVYTVLTHVDEEGNKELFLDEIPLSKENSNNRKINLSEIQSNINFAMLKLGENNDLILAGNYGDYLKYSNSFPEYYNIHKKVGTFIMSFDKSTLNKKIHNKIMHSPEMLCKEETKGNQKKFIKYYNKKNHFTKIDLLKLVLYNNIEDIIFRKDGGFFIINKHSLHRLSAGANSIGFYPIYKNNLSHVYPTKTNQIFISNGILITSFNKNGELEWDQVITKKQWIDITTPSTLKRSDQIFF